MLKTKANKKPLKIISKKLLLQAIVDKKTSKIINKTWKIKKSQKYQAMLKILIKAKDKKWN